MQGILYEEHSAFLFVLITVVLGGAAAWQTGTAIARTWRPVWQLVPTMLILAWAVRFLHFALFEGTLRSLHFYAVDLTAVAIFAYLGWRYARTAAMARQYGFAFEAPSAFTFRRKAG